ncbi:hypothetical protein Tco_1454446, partial [Tanacetum coccineum]
SIMVESLSPNHVFDFPANDPTLELEDPVMEVEEDHEEEPEENPKEEPKEDPNMDINEDEEDELSTLDTPTQPSTYEIGGPSSAVPEAPHPVGRPLSVVASRVALHHKEIEALHGELVASKLDETETQVLEIRGIVDNYPRGQVDALREEVDGLHGSTVTMSQRVQILETTLQEVRAENHDLQTRLSASESSERCMVACLLWMEERISALE